MTLKQRLDQRQVQKLILAPALQQAIKLLPLTNLELVEVIDGELAQNPMLEEDTPDARTVEREEEAETGNERPDDADLATRVEREIAEDFEAETQFQEYLDEGFPIRFSERKEAPALENILSRSPSLWDHLKWQADGTFFNEDDRRIAEAIIDNINEDGYLAVSEEELARLSGAPVEKIREIRDKIRAFDPVGCGSLDLREALLAQMDYLKIDDPTTRRIVEEHLPLFENHNYAQLAKTLGISLAEVKHHHEVIRRLDPKPGSRYSQEKTFYVVPDIVVTNEDNELKVSLNDEGVPRLRISSYYRKLLARAAKEDAATYAFLKEKHKKAIWFLRSLNQRDQTIYRVAKAIVDRQREFFEKGIDYIKPLTLVEIAREIGVHESTVGRVVANKFMMTPWGVFSLKYFFHKSLPGDFGEEVSSLKIKERIRRLVENEDKSRPLSDIEIGEILARNNLKVARRTVAKYRMQLKIPPSHIRKRKFVMEASS